MSFSGAEKRRAEMRFRSHTRGGLSVHILTISITRLGCIVQKKNQTVVMQGVIRIIAYRRYWAPHRSPFDGLLAPHYFSLVGGGGGRGGTAPTSVE